MVRPTTSFSSFAAAALLTALTMAAAGCGADTRRAETGTQSSAGAASSAAAPLTPASVTDPARRAYITRVDKICARLDPERNSATTRAGESETAGDDRQAASAYEESIASGERQLRQIQAIPEPAGDRAALQENVFAVIRQQLAIRRQIRAALTTQDVTAIANLRGRLDNLARSLVAFARGYGFRVCGES